MMIHKLIKVNANDNVAVALTDLKKDELVDIENFNMQLATDVNAKHKVALQTFDIGQQIIMYGVLVGKACKPIAKGEAITTENIKHESEKVNGKTKDFLWTPLNIEKWKNRTFMGYHRSDGKVGVANIWLFFPLVFCENRNIEILKDVFEKELLQTQDNDYHSLLRSLVSDNDGGTAVLEAPKKTRRFENIQVKFLTHQGGCGSDQGDAHALARLLAGYANNPNVAGATVLSLGCQHLQVKVFQDKLKELNINFDKPILIFEQQKMGTVDNLIKVAIKESFVAIEKANNIQRQVAPLSKLVVGLECGGSDGFSGISANPTLGYVSDLLASLGGASILSEFPELCGVEQDIVNRCVTEEKGKKFLHIMKTYEASAYAVGSGFDMNPSPGNIKDGLITDAIKSAGAAQKGGTSPIQDILDYSEPVTQQGLNLLCTPGNDVESTTAMVGSGATMVLFTTGLGTPTGNPIAPIIKVSSNNKLYEKMPDIIDFNTGKIIDGTKTIPEIASELLEYIIEVASGNIKSKAELLNQNDFIPWKRGVSL